MLFIRPTQLRVDLSAIRHNVREVAEAAAPAKVLAVVKANAYGHGAVQVSQAALEAGADMLAVALIEEGAQLRQAGVTAPILMLGTTDVHAAEAAVEYDVTPVVFLPEVLFALESAAAKKGVCASAQIKIDTGMNRIGVRTEEELSAVLDAVAKCPHIRITGALTHFATADVPESDFGGEQIARFERMTALMRARGLNFERHAAASAAAVRYPQARYDRVRAGIVMYGIDPLGQLDVRPALRWTTRVSYVKTIESGDTVSYGRRFTAARPTRIATLPVGYADGYRRSFSNRAQVLLHGRRVPVVGSVCMDQVMVDATGLDVQMGDETVLLGRQGEEEISCCELAQLDGTIPYEIMTGISARVPRVYEQQ